jgi:hypothetical protein
VTVAIMQQSRVRAHPHQKTRENIYVTINAKRRRMGASFRLRKTEGEKKKKKIKSLTS